MRAFGLGVDAESVRGARQMFPSARRRSWQKNPVIGERSDDFAVGVDDPSTANRPTTSFVYAGIGRLRGGFRRTSDRPSYHTGRLSVIAFRARYTRSWVKGEAAWCQCGADATARSSDRIRAAVHNRRARRWQTGFRRWRDRHQMGQYHRPRPCGQSAAPPKTPRGSASGQACRRSRFRHWG